jgi:hypothetical protein
MLYLFGGLMHKAGSRKKKLSSQICWLSLVCVSLLGEVACHAAAQSTQESVSPVYNDWSWFKDTYWVVPEQNISAVAQSATNPSQFNLVRDQTVFHFTDYFNGYFTGVVVAKLSSAESVPGCQYVLGEVTPQGVVHLAMYNVSDGSIINQPMGNMVQVNGQWTMVNTMTAPATGGGSVSHWAYMVLSKPGDPSWNNLPFANESVPAFVANCPAGPMINL